MKRLLATLMLVAPVAGLVACVGGRGDGGGAGADHDYAAAATPQTTAPTGGAVAGRTLFLRNCAHCHGADGHGDEGPDLHGLDVSDEWIANRIRNGKKGQMTAFAGKLQPEEIGEIIAYLRTLK